MKNNDWLDIFQMESQEDRVKLLSQEFYGKDRKGFCDFALTGIELLFQGIGYLSERTKKEELDEEKIFKNFKSALRYLAFYHYFRVCFTFKACYNLLLTGFYTEAAILLRSILETFVRLKYIDKSQNMEYATLALAGHKGHNSKKFKISYEDQFEKVAPGLYKFYRDLCDIAHGAWASHIIKIDVDYEKMQVNLDTGVVFKDYDSTYISNQFSVYLLAHLEYMMHLFPEIKSTMPTKYATKYHNTLKSLWTFFDGFSQLEGKEKWTNVVRKLINI